MIDISTGRYWDLPWSLVSGCTPCSPGCEHCWALSMERRFHPLPKGTILTHPERLSIPLKRRKPTVYAVWNDLFHEDVPTMFRNAAYAVMTEGAPRHTYLALSKRPTEMLRFVTNSHINELWPNSNIWHGLTIINQKEADEKIPLFLQIPGKKFLSIEPMLSGINILPYIGHQAHHCKCGWHETEENLHFMGGKFFCPSCGEFADDYNGIDSVILGGETGPGARPMHPDWVRSVRDQCAAAGVPFFFKQWGEWYSVTRDVSFRAKMMNDPQWHIWPDEGEESTVSRRVGRMKSGRTLDGKEWNDLPWVKC